MAQQFAPKVVPMSEIPQFHATYAAQVHALLHALNGPALASLVEVLRSSLVAGRTVFIIGNGGSAALASHFACDLGKSLLGADPRTNRSRFRVRSLTDNTATLTAWANDEGYTCVFSEQLRASADPGDAVVAISASGNSPNIVEGLRWARANGLRTVGLLGKQGGASLELCDAAVVVPSDDYGLIEGLHGVLTHEITSWLMAELAVMPRVVGESATPAHTEATHP